MTYITNDCLAYFLYQKRGEEYASPLIGSLFPSDKQFVQFCNNFEFYIQQIPVFSLPILKTKIDTEQMPVMFLGGIEIHWPHEKDESEVREKFLRRLERVKEPQFIWSDDQMLQGYDDVLRQQFKGTFIEVKRIQGYTPKSLNYNALADYILGTKTPEISYHNKC